MPADRFLAKASWKAEPAEEAVAQQGAADFAETNPPLKPAWACLVHAHRPRRLNLCSMSLSHTSIEECILTGAAMACAPARCCCGRSSPQEMRAGEIVWGSGRESQEGAELPCNPKPETLNPKPETLNLCREGPAKLQDGG